MDPFVMIFYAVVCGILGWTAPNLGGSAIRLGVGAVVGVVAATILPVIRVVLGL